MKVISRRRLFCDVVESPSTHDLDACCDKISEHCVYLVVLERAKPEHVCPIEVKRAVKMMSAAKFEAYQSGGGAYLSLRAKTPLLMLTKLPATTRKCKQRARERNKDALSMTGTSQWRTSRLSQAFYTIPNALWGCVKRSIIHSVLLRNLRGKYASYVHREHIAPPRWNLGSLIDLTNSGDGKYPCMSYIIL